MEAIAGTDAVSLGPQRVAVTSPNRGFTIKMADRGSCFAVGLREPAMRRRLAGLLGDDPADPLAFAPAMELSAGAGIRFARQMGQLAGDFFNGGSIFRDPLTASLFEEAMVTELLLRHAHNYSDKMARLDSRISPRDMRRAAEFIEAHLDTPITIGDVAAASGVAGRTLFKHFQEARGTSPMRYIRDLRFEKARQALKAHRLALVDPKIKEHRGRIVTTTGDGILVEFASVVDAVRCATEVQRGMAERNADIPKEKRIEFRVGINLGDIIVEGSDIVGDGVNIAARLEALAEPGGICISQTVLNHARDKLQFEVEDAGDQAMKNIARPVRVYRVRLGPEAAPNEPSAILDRPSTAILAFNNMSGDPTQEFFADGIAEDITTLLSRLPGFFVIARNSTFTYKGRAVDTRQVARELGVRYVLEGSVQKAGQRARVTAQLIEANSGNHIWAEKYDRNVEDIFVVQDEITQGIYAALKTHLLFAEAEFAQRKPPQSLDAWGYTVRAWVKWYYITPENFVDVVALARRAISLQPDYGPAHAILSAALGFGSYTAVSDDLMAMGREALAEARKAIELDGDNPDVLLAAGAAHYFLGLFKKLHGLLERAVELNPNNAMARGTFGNAQAILGRPDDGIELIERAMRLSPRDPQT